MNSKLQPPPAAIQEAPSIRRVKRLVGHTLVMRDAAPEDAEFIVSIRTDQKKSRFINATPPDLSHQVRWLEAYSAGTGQAYFIIESEGGAIGTVRIYDGKDYSFCWGSWIIKDSSPLHAAVESALMIYVFAIEHLGFCRSHFDVRKENKSVLRFHERFGAKRVCESVRDVHYEIEEPEIRRSCKKFAKYLPNGVSVFWP